MRRRSTLLAATGLLLACGLCRAADPAPPAEGATKRLVLCSGKLAYDLIEARDRQSDGATEIVPNTRESKLAPYLDAWRRKVERLGTLNFPKSVRNRGETGNPVLEVSIRADGSLGDTIVRRSSGRKEVDQAALSILRLASPFDPFPSELRKQYHELRFAYEWQFLDGEAP